MAILGAHQSIAGGYYKAVEIAHRLKGWDCGPNFVTALLAYELSGVK
jgi:hypothetical protein